MVLRLNKSLKAWATSDFTQVVQQEISQLDLATLPLQQGLSISSQVIHRPVQAMILETQEEADLIRVRAGIFYTGIISGCSCADDPSPTTEQNEYCVMEFCIDKQSSQTTVALLPD
ncbi:MAG: hypothetical protein ACYC4K_01510 [Thiobacillus sp.]